MPFRFTDDTSSGIKWSELNDILDSVKIPQGLPRLDFSDIGLVRTILTSGITIEQLELLSPYFPRIGQLIPYIRFNKGE